MDKAQARSIATRVQELLKPLEEELGLTVSPLGGSFDPSGSLVLKVEFAELRDGVVMTREAVRLVQEGGLYGLPDDCLGKEFVSGGQTFVLTGMTLRSQKWPFTARNVGDSKTYKMSKSSVLSGFGVKVDRAEEF